MEPLFLEHDLTFEKLSAGTTMPEDPNKWPQEILQELFRQVPYMSDFQPHIEMQKSDAEAGYGFGHILVSHQTEAQAGTPPDAQAAAGLREVRIPIIIKDNLLAPIDLLVTDDAQVLPLTEARLRAAIFRPQAFDVTSKTPGDQSMIGQLYPPYRQNYGFGGGGVAMSAGTMKEGSALEEYLTDGLEKEGEEGKGWSTKKKLLAGAGALGAAGLAAYGMKRGLRPKTPAASVKGVEKPFKPQKLDVKELEVQKFSPQRTKTGSVLEAISDTMNVSDVDAMVSTLADPQMKLACEQNAAAVLPSLKIILGRETSEKRASVQSLVKPTVMQVLKTDDGYVVKTASHVSWAPEEVLVDRGAALRSLGAKVVLAADMSGGVTLSEDEGVEEPAEPDTDMDSLGPVTEPGMYKVQAEDGQELVGYVIPSLVDADGQEVPLALFTNGSQSAVQADILGVPVQGDPSGIPTADAPEGTGAFVTVEGDQLRATIPLTMKGSSTGPDPNEPVMFMAETFDGRSVEVSLQPNIQAVVGTPEGRMLVPGHWKWLPLGAQETVDLASGEQEVNKQAQARRKYASVEVVSGGSTFSVRGFPVEKLASDQREFLGFSDALFLLSGLGAAPAYSMRKLAEARLGAAPVQVRVAHWIKTAEQQKRAAAEAASQLSIPALRRRLFKEAAVITDPEAVDAVLSLGFINPENITTFVGYLPELDRAQAKLCELLMAARLGLSDVPEGALETSVRATEEVLEGLKAMAFQGPAQYQ